MWLLLPAPHTLKWRSLSFYSLPSYEDLCDSFTYPRELLPELNTCGKSLLDQKVINEE